MACCGVVLRPLSAPVWLDFEPVGRWFECDASQHCAKDESTESDEDSDSDKENEEEQTNPLLLDPSQWKDQDHYSVLGLGKIRYRAKAEDIRKAYRQKVLQHHPDKQQQSAEDLDDDHFKCIKIAYDILSDPKCRRAYDSADPTFSDDVPTVCELSKEHFFDVFGPVFEDNVRWSNVQPVPSLGNMDTPIEEVNSFYDFWYGFNSWRDFSYSDEHHLDKAESREEKRWMEKQNKSSRLKRKKEEMVRLRTLTDNAYACDPRVRRHKEAEKAEKLARKRQKEEAVRLEAEGRERERQERLAEERKKAELEEEEARLQAEQARKERSVVKNALKKARKSFRTACVTVNYFATGDGDLVTRMEETEKLSATLPAEKLQQLSEQFTALSLEEARTIFTKEVLAVQQQEREATEEQARIAFQQSATSKSTVAMDTEWSNTETQLLIKAVVVYPAGTQKRWEVITRFINNHAPDGCTTKTEKQVIAKVKSMQKVGAGDREAENKMAFSKFAKDHLTKGQVEAPPTQRYDGPKPWTAEEQKLLEDALRTHPSSVEERWEKISAAVGTRTKVECVNRVKELVAKVKAKKQGT
ncbi:hypothetical protein EMCRGX_G003961 [Ephydatia muelleri]